MNKTLDILLIVIAVLVVATGAFIAGTIYGRSYAYGPDGMTLASGASAGVNGNALNIMRDINNSAKITPLTVDQAKAVAEKFLANLNNSDLKIAEIMIFDNNAYVVVKESSTGLGAFELLVDSTSQIAYPEHGPNMMWNLKYGGLNHQYMTLAPHASAGGGGSNGMTGGNNGMMGNAGMINIMGGNGGATITPADVPA